MKIKFLGTFFNGTLLLINAIICLLMIICAYSPYVDPSSHPYMACLGLAFPIFYFLTLFFVLFWLVIKWKFALLPILSLFICYNQCYDYMPTHLSRPEPTPNSIKFLSYNVMAFEQDKPHTQENQNDILVYLLNSNADIICIQEYMPGNRLTQSQINQVLKKYPYRHYYKIGGGLNGLGCYSRFPILKATPIEYPSQANGSIAYTLKWGMDTLTVINNHLESNKLSIEDKQRYKEMFIDPEKEQIKDNSRYFIKKLADAVKIRAVQARAIAGFIKEKNPKNLIVCGDFNDSPISYAHHTIEKGLVDAFTESGTGAGISYNRGGFYFRIDNILHSDRLISFCCTVDNSIKNSDHYPIWCYIDKKTE